GVTAVLRGDDADVWVGALRVAVLTRKRAETCARSLAPFVDPDSVGAKLSQPVAASELMGMPEFSATAIRDRWGRRRSDRLTVPVGMTDAGPFVLDLIADGPHALVGGTTGSGKSELLRTLVAG